ncbi:MAG TPA: tripartite tricarboxylate transporter substrate binding protein [Burkholderiales bacterium]|nr:tripartite tricarboxylate transporter substrate binding protein [Burkholderiales bacterium]
MLPVLIHYRHSTLAARYCASVIAAALLGAAACAAPFPSKPVRVVVPWPPGGPSDTLARIVMGSVGDMLGQRMVIDNRPGASAVIGTELVVKAVPDGYTLLWAIANHTTNHLLFKVSYDPIRDFAAVGQVARSSYMLVVHPGVPARTLKEFVGYVKTRPGKIAYASAGSGTLQHLGMELFSREAALELVHVPYKGSAPAVLDVLGGQVPVTFEASATVLPHVQVGRMRVLAVATLKRLPQLPEVPTVAESGYPGFEVTGFTGVLAPAGTPADAIGVLNAALDKAIGNAEVAEKMTVLGLEPVTSTPAQFRAFLQAEVPKYSKILRDSGAKAN